MIFLNSKTYCVFKKHKKEDGFKGQRQDPGRTLRSIKQGFSFLHGENVHL